MSKAAVVTTRDSVGAFEALGFVGTAVEDSLEAAQAVQSIVRSGEFGLVLLTSDVADAWSGSQAARRLVVPVVLVVPVTSSASGAASAAVRRLIESAVGIDLVGKMMEEKSHDTR
ncbi:MAG: V-type ATP synthase subunit F [Candidatus Cryosericum sp.]|jgi:V/A-type H+/Na+-transporting ATPase subunit F